MTRTNRPVVSSRLKVAELRDICSGMGLLTTGLKKDLLVRVNQANGTTEQTNTTITNNNTEVENNTRRDLLEEQEREFQEGLRQDKVKAVEKSINDGSYASQPTSNIKLYLDSKFINYDNIIEKDELIALLSPKDEVVEETKEEDIQLTKEELRKARLRFYQ